MNHRNMNWKMKSDLGGDIRLKWVFRECSEIQTGTEQKSLCSENNQQQALTQQAAWGALKWKWVCCLFIVQELSRRRQGSWHKFTALYSRTRACRLFTFKNILLLYLMKDLANCWNQRGQVPWQNISCRGLLLQVYKIRNKDKLLW